MLSFRLTKKLVKSTAIAYNNFVTSKPYLSQAIQVSFLMGVGDVVAQSLIEKNSIRELNVRRTAEFASLGFVMVGPCLRFWYGQLDKIFKVQKVPWKKTMGKVCLDQLLFAPIFVAVFTSTISKIQGFNLENIIIRLKENYISIMLTNYSIWPAAQLINFALIPLNYQVIFVQFVAIIWNTYLSSKLANKSLVQ